MDIEVAMPLPRRSSTADEVVGKVLRRAEVSKMARKLQDRLALASYKTKIGRETTNLNTLEANVDDQIKRKRPGSSMATSDTSSSGSDNQLFSGTLGSSPITAPVYSDDMYGPENPIGLRKKARFEHTYVDNNHSSTLRTRTRARSMAPPAFSASHRSWKSTHHLAESSPIQHNIHPDFRTAHGPNISFASETSTIPNSPGFGPVSDEEDQLPVRSFQLTTGNRIHASPPRTPPPTRTRSQRQRGKGGSEAAGEEGADLLLYLATSPSPAGNRGASKAIGSARLFSPSTPPSNNTALPSSMMSTPGGTHLFAGYNTPGQNFNFSDFVNVTPSPAQGAFGSARTPGLGGAGAKTPLAAKEARRRLNFDTLVPPGGSPNVSNVGRGSSSTGLGMELGGELVS